MAATLFGIVLYAATLGLSLYVKWRRELRDSADEKAVGIAGIEELYEAMDRVSAQFTVLSESVAELREENRMLKSQLAERDGNRRVAQSAREPNAHRCPLVINSWWGCRVRSRISWRISAIPTSSKNAQQFGIIAKRCEMATPSIVRDSSSELIEAVREGLPYEAFEDLREALELSNEELAALLEIPRRTLTKRKNDGAFTPSESNAISRVARVYRDALTFFEEPSRTRRWMKTPLPALEGSSPVELLDTDPGAQVVSELIQQLVWGIYP